MAIAIDTTIEARGLNGKTYIIEESQATTLTRITGMPIVLAHLLLGGTRKVTYLKDKVEALTLRAELREWLDRLDISAKVDTMYVHGGYHFSLYYEWAESLHSPANRSKLLALASLGLHCIMPKAEDIMILRAIEEAQRNGIDLVIQTTKGYNPFMVCNVDLLNPKLFHFEWIEYRRLKLATGRLRKPSISEPLDVEPVGII